VFDASETALRTLNDWHVQVVVGVTWAILALHLTRKAKWPSETLRAQAVSLKAGSILGFAVYAEVKGPSMLFGVALVGFMCVWLVFTGTVARVNAPGAGTAAWGGDACVIGYVILNMSADPQPTASLAGQFCSALGLVLIAIGGSRVLWGLIRPAPRLQGERETV
jgi:hypothetical protein